MNHAVLPSIVIDETILPFVSKVRNLRVVTTAGLSWRSHVMSMSRRVHFSLHRLKFHGSSLSREVRTSLIVSLIFPLLYYCCLVYDDFTNELNTKL